MRGWVHRYREILMIRPLMCVAVPTLLSQSVLGQVVLVSQERSVTAITSLNGDTDTQSATGFGTFIATASSVAGFATPTGSTGVNAAESTINCLVDPNAIRAAGSLNAAGGLAVVGGAPSSVFGEAGAVIFVTFTVLVPTPFELTAMPRPSSNPRDEFQLELSGPTDVIRLDERDAPQFVNLSGILQPGEYTLQYTVELTGEDAQTAADYGFNLVIPAPQVGAVLAGAGLMAARRRRR